MNTEKWLNAQLDAARLLVNEGSAAMRQSNVPVASEALEEASAILDMAPEVTEEVRKLRARVLNELGVISQRRNDLDAARRYHREAANMCETLTEQGVDFVGNSAATHLNLSSILLAAGDLEEAKAAGAKALELVDKLREAEEKGVDGLAMGALQNMAVIHARSKDLDAADEAMDKAIELAAVVAAQGHPNVNAQVAQGCQQLSVVMFESEKYDEALKWGRVAADLSEKGYEALGKPALPIYIVSQINLISYYERMALFAEAEDCLWKAVEVAGNDPQILRRGQAFYENCRKQADIRLEKGNLPREEVEEGYADLRARIEEIGGLPAPQQNG